MHTIKEESQKGAMWMEDILEKRISCLKGILLGDLEYNPGDFRMRSKSSRSVEVPWLAWQLRKHAPASLLDIGFSLGSIECLALLMEYDSMGGNLAAVDIVSPERVRNRYPESLRSQILEMPISIGDVRNIQLEEGGYDAVSMISVIEHIGYDQASLNDHDSAFRRFKNPNEVVMRRDKDVDLEVLNNIFKALKPGGVLFVTVPAGSGGGVLLRDSLGYYCAQWEYDLNSWRHLTGHAGFLLKEELFFAVDEDLNWNRVESYDYLSGLDAVQLEYSRGVALAVLEKI